MPETDKQKIGKLGEDVAVRYLENLGHKILERNYWKKWGEIDIISRKGDLVHFVEVKSTTSGLKGDYEPEELVHTWKRKRLKRALETYILEGRVDNDFQVDVIVVHLNMSTRVAEIKYLPDVEL